MASFSSGLFVKPHHPLYWRSIGADSPQDVLREPLPTGRDSCAGAMSLGAAGAPVGVAEILSGYPSPDLISRVEGAREGSGKRAGAVKCVRGVALTRSSGNHSSSFTVMIRTTTRVNVVLTL